MNKLTYTIALFGSTIFFVDVSYGIGWVVGWIFIGLLNHYREPILDRVIDLKNFSMIKYFIYLFGVMIWIAVPLIISIFIPNTINAIAIFGAYIIDYVLKFVTKSFV